MAEVFISYSSKDRATARAFADALSLEGFTCWYDQRMQGAEVWDETIDREIRAAGVVVTLWTPDAVASRWVRSEADYAFENNKLLPVIVSPCELPLAYRLIQAFNLQTPPGQLRNHARWRDFVARLREFLAINTVANMAERERTEKERQRRARNAKFWRRAAIAGAAVVLGLVATAAGVWWFNERASAVAVQVTADGAALSLSNLRARRIASIHFIDPPSGPGPHASWAPMLAIAPQAEALLVEWEGGVRAFNRTNGVWDWEHPVHMEGWSCAAETQSEIPPCAFSRLYAFGERRMSSSPFQQGIQMVGRLVAAISFGKELRVWSLPGGHRVNFGEPLGGCPPSERPPVACNVEMFAPDPFDSSFMLGLADGSIYDLGVSSTPGDTVLAPETSRRGGRLIMRRPGHVPIGIAFGERGAAAISWDDGQINFEYGNDEAELVSAAAAGCGPARLGMSGDAMNIVAMCTPSNEAPYLRRFTRTAWQEPWIVTYTAQRNSPIDVVGDDVAVTTDGRFVIERSLFDHGSPDIYDTERGRLIQIESAGGLRLARLRGREVLIGFTSDSPSSALDAVSILDVEGGRVLARAHVGGFFGMGVVGFDDHDVYAAYPDYDTGDVVLWRITDPGGPLVQIPTATR